ncbi:MAG: hypothetical protein IJW82_03580, partial [Clostridia bacterium]|nr:hypothetical protein [Clostridia bacterium]
FNFSTETDENKSTNNNFENFISLNSISNNEEDFDENIEELEELEILEDDEIQTETNSQNSTQLEIKYEELNTNSLQDNTLEIDNSFEQNDD